MADTPEYAATPDPFDVAVADLAARLRELGASPQEAAQAAAQTVAGNSITRPSPMQPPDRSGVRAGQFGLPPMPDVPRNALAGEMRSTNTPMGDMIGAYDSGLGALASKAERGAGYVTRGAAELTGVPQAVRAGDALGDALLDPSLANVTNAGTQAALAVGRPITAAGALGAGYLTAGAKDLGLLDISANAQQPKKGATELPGLPPAMNAEYAKLRSQADRGAYRSYDERDNILRRIKQIEDASTQMLMEQAKSANQGERDRLNAEEARKTAAETARLDEYNRAVKTAETARDTELARNRRFSDTEVGKMWDKTGGAAPFFLGVPMGAVTRMATGGKNAMDKWGTPLLMGGAEGIAASNIPLAYNSFVTEPDNPEKRAYSAYARELPPDHPRKAEYAGYAAGLEDKNPVRKAASEELYDLGKAMERGFFGGVEGAAGALFGNKLVGATSRYSGRAGPALGATQLEREAASLERNALAGPPEAASAAAASRPTSAATDVPLNPLATGLMPARARGQVGQNAPGQQLGSEALSNRPPSEILGSIQRAPREVPTTFPQSTPAANPAPAKSANMPEWASEPPQGIKLTRGQFWDGKINQPRNADGTLAEMPKYKASRPKAEKSQPKPDAPVSKPSIQIDDMAPYGRRTLADE